MSMHRHPAPASFTMLWQTVILVALACLASATKKVDSTTTIQTPPISHSPLPAQYENIVEGAQQPVDLFPDRPLQIVQPDSDHKNLVINEENLKYLHAIKDSVSIISVVGKFHSGKSFLMNQIMSKSSGFGIGKEVTPKTMGIWMWGKPLRSTNKKFDGWVLLFDTEGFAANNISENYDAKIFAVSTLLSSKLLYNSVKIIDQSDIDYLELLARRTQLFALKAQMTPQNWTEDFSSQLLRFPSLIWVLQDFVQETNEKTCKDWLLKLLSTHTRETESYAISLKDVFPDVDCHTLFIPCAKKALLSDLSRSTEADLLEDYKVDRDGLIRKIMLDIEPKLKTNDKPFSGTELVFLLRILVNAANAGSLTEIPNRWDAFLDKLKQSSIEECFKFYQAHMNNFLVDRHHNQPVNSSKLYQWHLDSEEKSLKLLTHLLQGLERFLDSSQKNLLDIIDKWYYSVREINTQKIQVKIFNLKKKYEMEIGNHFVLLRYPLLTEDLLEMALNLTIFYTDRFVNEMSDLLRLEEMQHDLDSLERIIKLNLDSSMLENYKALEKHFDEIIDKVVEEAFQDVTISDITPSSFKAFMNHLNTLITKSVQTFATRSNHFASETSIYRAKLDKVKVQLNIRAEVLRKDNEEAVSRFLSKEADKAVAFFEQSTTPEKLNFPLDFEVLKETLHNKATQVKNVWMDDFRDYTDYICYPEQLTRFVAKLSNVSEVRRDQNIQAFKTEVEAPLELAKKLILLSSDRYTTLFSFRRFIYNVCMVHLDEGKAKEWKTELKNQIIDVFIRDDAQLSSEIEKRQNFLSKLMGFFQWLYSLIFG